MGAEFDSRATAAIDEAPSQRRADFADAEVIQLKNGLLFDGYAAVFDKATDLGPFVEEIRHGAFRRYLATHPNIPFCLEHDPTQLLGTTGSGRVRLTEEQRGLRVQANLADTDLSRRVQALTDSGDIKGMSFGFVAGKNGSDWGRRDGKAYRTIKDFKRVLDVCTTWDPAYADTEAQFRSLAFAKPESSDVLQQLLMGAYPQLGEQGQTPDPATPVEAEAEETAQLPGVSTPLLAAMELEMDMLALTLGDEE